MPPVESGAGLELYWRGARNGATALIAVHVRNKLHIVVVANERMRAWLDVAVKLGIIGIDKHSFAQPGLTERTGIFYVGRVVDDQVLSSPFIELCNHEHRRMQAMSRAPLLLEIETPRCGIGESEAI